MGDLERLTCYTREQLTGKCLDVSAWEWSEVVDLQEVEHALTVEICDNADVVPEVEALPQMNAFVPVVLVVLRECREDSELDPRGIAVFLY